MKSVKSALVASAALFFVFSIVVLTLRPHSIGVAAQSTQTPPSTSDRGGRGKALYDTHCAECHGETGKGDGPASGVLHPKPRDFTAGKYKLRTTESGSIPTDDDLVRSVRQGVYATAMPGWQTLLSEGDILAVVDYIKSFSPRFATETPRPVDAGAPVPSSVESIARGQSAYEKLRCASCHGNDGRGAGAITVRFQDDWQQPLTATDLTETWTFRGGATAHDVFLRFRTGMSGTPMPSFADAATAPEMWDLANYVISLGRKPLWSMDATEVAAFYARQQTEAKADPVKHGEQLIESLGCSLCHSPVDEHRRMIPGMRLAGGVLIRIEPYGDYPSGNLTSDKDTGLGNWTDDQIKQVIVRGTLPDGTRLLPFPMDWASFSTLTPDDLNAIVAYLRTVPPVSNKVPKPVRRFLPLYMWGKFKLLILGDDPPMTFFTGNYGQPAGGR